MPRSSTTGLGILRASRRSVRTQTIYAGAARALIEYLRTKGLPTRADKATRKHLETYFGDFAARPRQRKPGQTVSASYVSQHYRALQQLFRWLADVEEEIKINPFDRMRAPAVPDKRVEVFTDDELRALLVACKSGSFDQRPRHGAPTAPDRHRRPTGRTTNR